MTDKIKWRYLHKQYIPLVENSVLDNQSAFTSRQTHHPYKAQYRQVPCVVGCYINNII